MVGLLEMRGVTKSYGVGSTEVHALRGVDLSVVKGEIGVEELAHRGYLPSILAHGSQ